MCSGAEEARGEPAGYFTRQQSQGSFVRHRGLNNLVGGEKRGSHRLVTFVLVVVAAT